MGGKSSKATQREKNQKDAAGMRAKSGQLGRQAGFTSNLAKEKKKWEMHKENTHDADIRSVIGAAQEVRLCLRDSRVIFCSVISSAGTGAQSFVVRPWGVEAPTTIKYDDVWRVTSVTEMVWQRQKAISRAQLDGIFAD
jgi:hypothetical protein